MRFKTDKILGGLNVNGISKFAKVAKAEPQKMGAIQMTGVYAKGSLDSSVPLSNFSVPQHIVDKYANVNPPKGKPTQLVIADADYIPDKEYADVES